MKRYAEATGDEVRSARGQRSLAHEAFRDLIQQVNPPTMRAALSESIHRHGGAASVVQQMGFQPGTKEYRSTLRTVERHSTLAGQRRGGATLSPKYQALYEKVIGKGSLADIKSAPKGGTSGGDLPSKGTVAIAFTGQFQVSEDVRNRRIQLEVDADDEEFWSAFKDDPIAAWEEYAGFAPDVQTLDVIEMLYDSGEDEE